VTVEISTQMRRRIRERWEELRPRLTWQARRTCPNPTLTLRAWLETHERRIEMLLLSGVKLRKIRQYNYDDPSHEFEHFITLLNKAVRNLRHRPLHAAPKGLAKFLEPEHTTQGEM
jgi:hypothetical protein